MRKVLEQGGLSADDVQGMGEVTTAEEFHKALPPGEGVWLTFSNQAYLHFAQNWYTSIKNIGRHRNVIVAALDDRAAKVLLVGKHRTAARSTLNIGLAELRRVEPHVEVAFRW